MKSTGYMNRAMKARDPRFRRILGKLGYDTQVPVVETKAEKAPEEIDFLRAAYEEKTGSVPDKRWGVSRLKKELGEG